MFSFATIAALGSVFAGGLAAPQGGPPWHDNSFESSCRRWSLEQQGRNAWLQAYCTDTQGLQWHSVINLNHCIANDSGKLAGRSEGEFAASCSDMEVVWDTTLIARCGGGAGSSTAIRLGDIVTNDNGELSCYGIRGCAFDASGCTDKPAGKGAVKWKN